MKPPSFPQRRRQRKAETWPCFRAPRSTAGRGSPWLWWCTSCCSSAGAGQAAGQQPQPAHWQRSASTAKNRALCISPSRPNILTWSASDTVDTCLSGVAGCFEQVGMCSWTGSLSAFLQSFPLSIFHSYLQRLRGIQGCSGCVHSL